MNEPAGAHVECYSGHAYAGEPRAVLWRGQRLVVERVTARWRTPSGPAYRVSVRSDACVDVRAERCLELHYDDSAARWSVSEVGEPDGA